MAVAIPGGSVRRDPRDGAELRGVSGVRRCPRCERGQMFVETIVVRHAVEGQEWVCLQCAATAPVGVGQ